MIRNKSFIIKAVVLGFMAVWTLTVSAKTVTLVNPAYQGRPFFAETAIHDSLFMSQNPSVMTGANIICQMAGFPELAKSHGFEPDLELRLVVKPRTEIFIPQSIIDAKDLYTLTSAGDPGYPRHQVFDESQAPKFWTQNGVDECTIATACRNLKPIQALNGVIDFNHPYIQQCADWRAKTNNVLVYSRVTCQTNETSKYDADLEKEIESFHRRTANRFHLDVQSYDDEIIRLERQQCENDLARGSTELPKAGECDYNMASPYHWDSPLAGARPLMKETPFMYLILSGRFKALRPDTPVCTREVLAKYAPLFLKPEYGLNKYFNLNSPYIPFCVDSVSQAAYSTGADSLNCEFTVKGHDFLQQPNNVNIKMDVNLDPSATGRRREKMLADAAARCTAAINCWQASQISCKAVNFCPPPGISSDSNFRYQK